MSKYQPTGRPPGRPAKSAVEKQGIQDVTVRLKSTTQDLRFMPLVAICPDCFPNGWDVPGLRAVQCWHGTWVKRL